MPLAAPSRADLRDDIRLAVGNLRAARERIRYCTRREHEVELGIARRHAGWLEGFVRENWPRRNEDA